MSLYSSTLFNVLYSLLKFGMGIRLKSTWLSAIGIFYLTLILIRFPLIWEDIRGLRAKQPLSLAQQWIDYRRTGWLMLMMNVGLSAIHIHVVVRNESFTYPGMLIYAMAFFAFYRLILAVIRIVRGKGGSPLFKAARAVDFSFAVTAMFTLQTAMYAYFSPGMDVRFQNTIVGIMAMGVVTGIAVSLIIKGNRKIRALQVAEEGRF